MSTRSQDTASRRSMLKAAMAGCGMMSHVSVMSTLLNLQATKALVADSGATDYKALVCVFMLGGNDSHNMLAPRNNASSSNPTEYDDYASARGGFDDGSGNNPGGLAIPETDFDDGNGNITKGLLHINDPTNLSGRSFGLHPGMGMDPRVYDSGGNVIDDGDNGVGGGVAKLYNDGNLSFLTNIGSLISPTSRTIYNSNVNRPLGLFSHADLTRHWMTGAPHTRSQITGWGGNLADLFAGTNSNPVVSMNISLSGTNLYQTGGITNPYAIGTNGATKVTDYSPTSTNVQRQIFTQQYDSVLAQTYGNLLAKSFSETHRGATDAAISFNDAIGAVSLATNFDQGDTLSRQLQMIAKTIKVAPQLGQTRQVFFVTIGGFDNHSGLITAHDTLLPRVSRAMKSFYDATVEMGCEDDVVTFSASEFARTLGSNGQGSDHAWGGNNIVMGGGIDGGKIFGEHPLSLLNPVADFTSLGHGIEDINLGRGRMIPTTSVDVMAAELAMWFGVNSAADLKTTLPNIENFYDFAGSGGAAPVGFLL